MLGSKQILDIFFQKNYDRLYKLSEARCKKYGRNIDAGSLVSNCYEYLYSQGDKITKETVQIYAFRYITMQTYWTRSETNRLEKIQTLSLELPDVEDDKTDIDFYINLEMWYQDRKSLLAMYLARPTTDKLKHRVLSVMLEHNIWSCTDIANHFDISRSGAWLIIRDLKDDIADFAKAVNDYDNFNNF